MNWGTKIVLGMIAFMLFIIGMVVYMFKSHGNDALVEEDYYEKGINYDKEYDAKKNTLDDDATPIIKITETQVVIQLKDAADYQLLMLRPSAIKEDMRANGKTTGDNHLITVEKSTLARGLWSMRLAWQVGGKEYLYKKDITL